MSDALHPNFAMLYLTQFEQAYETHKAAGAARQLRNSDSVDKNMNPTIVAQRQQLLDIATQILINQRNKLLDEFCVSWLKYRNLPIPE